VAFSGGASDRRCFASLSLFLSGGGEEGRETDS